MSCVDSSVVSSSAFLVLASSLTRLLFLSRRSLRYFSSSFLGSLAARAVVLGIEISLLLLDVPSDTGRPEWNAGSYPRYSCLDQSFRRRRPLSHKDFRDTPSRLAASVRL